METGRRRPSEIETGERSPLGERRRGCGKRRRKHLPAPTGDGGASSEGQRQTHSGSERERCCSRD